MGGQIRGRIPEARRLPRILQVEIERAGHARRDTARQGGLAHLPRPEQDDAGRLLKGTHHEALPSPLDHGVHQPVESHIRNWICHDRARPPMSRRHLVAEIGRLATVTVPAPENPYQPGRGVAPPVMAGRVAEMACVERRLAELVRRRPCSEDILFYGPRGNGKTTLLLETERRARQLGLRAEYLPVDALTDPERLVGALQKRAGAVEGGVTGVQIAGFGATAERAAPSREVSELLGSWVAADPSPLVLLLDEIHALEPVAARPFFDAVQRAKGDRTPFLLVAAGTPDAPRRLRGAGTFNERGFERLRVGRLRRSDTSRALAEPAARSGRPMTSEAQRLLARESQDYPWFIQLLGSAAWDAAADEAEIGSDAARRGREAVRPRVADFYQERFDEAWEAGIAEALPSLCRLFQEHAGGVPDPLFRRLVEVQAASDAVAVGRVELRNRLLDLGVVWQAAPGVWEMGIPSFASFVLAREGLDALEAAAPS